MVYFPSVRGDTTALRAGVEGFLDGSDQSMVNERLSALDKATQAAGMQAAFGFEIECSFIGEPESTTVRYPDEDALYESVVWGMPGARPFLDYEKGSVVFPRDDAPQMMLNRYHESGTYNPDQPGSGILEFRTWPADPLEAKERYWNVIDTIGKVASRSGMTALLLATHVNSGVLQEWDNTRIFLRYDREAGSTHLAATQHNLVAARALQLDASLEDGIVIQEAFPSKDAPTVIHGRRLEFRHPIVGVADPRVDMLAVLSGLQQTVEGTVSQAATRKLQPCQDFRVNDRYAAISLSLAYVNSRTGRFVMPSQIGGSDAWTEDSYHRLNSFLYDITGRYEDIREPQGEKTTRDLIGALRVKDGKIAVDSRSPYARLLSIAFEGAGVELEPMRYRVTPEVDDDSPDDFEARREGVKKSSIVRRIMGKAIKTVVPADEAIARRRDLVDTHMIVTS